MSAADGAMDELNSAFASSAGAGALGFGCAELFRLPSARARREVLDAAFDAGVRHFDVAPMYGLGAAERELGSFVRTRRDRVVVATKFGIGVTQAARALGRVQGPVRRVLEARPSLRAQARTRATGPTSGLAGALVYTSPGYGAAAARASLEHSLRALRVDRVDLFLLHDPTVDGVHADDASGYLERARTEGWIGAWGVAEEPAPTWDVVARLGSPPDVVQIRDDIFERSLERAPAEIAATRITFGSLGAALARIMGHLAEQPEALQRWSGLVGHDCGDPELVAALLLRHARLRNPSGMTLFSTTRVERLGQAAAAVTSSTLDESVAVFIELVEAELSGASKAVN